MKRILAALLALTLLVCGALTLTSCAPKPELYLEEAKDNLEDADYEVSHVDDEDMLSPAVKESLSAHDDDNYLYIVVFNDTKSAKLAYKEFKLESDQEIEALELEIKSIKHYLKKYEDDLDSDVIDEYEDELKDLEKELEEEKDEFVVGRSGKTVWYGTKDAIKDSKGK